MTRARRSRSQAGFTLPELLTTMWIAMVVLLAGFALLDFVMKRTAEAGQRVEATQRARTAMDVITRELRSQVCLDTNTPPIVDGTPTQVTFYTDLGNSTASSLPERHVLSYNAGAGTITEAVSKPIAGKPVTWTAPTTRTVVSGVTTFDGVSTTPIFRYFSFTGASTWGEYTTSASSLATQGVAGKVAKINIAFRTVAQRGARSSVGISLSDDVYSRTVNPNPPDSAPASFIPLPACT